MDEPFSLYGDSLFLISMIICKFIAEIHHFVPFSPSQY